MAKNDDVLDFINSLPDSKLATPKPTQPGKDEDFLEFLDELAQHEKKKPVKKMEPRKKDDADGESKAVPVAAGGSTDGSGSLKDDAGNAGDELNAAAELDINPIGTISNWWSNEGSSKVSSLWGTIASNAQNIGEQTYQLASTTTNQLNQQRQKLLEDGDGVPDLESAEQQIFNLSSRFNSILLTMSNQIKQGLISHDDELLNILVIYDMYNLNYLDRLAHDNFNRVMGQVEGGIRVTVNNFNHNDTQPASHERNSINLNMFHGKVIDGEKLCFANLESSIKDYEKVLKLEHAADDDVEPINTSNIFISFQPITTKVEAAAGADNKDVVDDDDDKPILIESNNQDSFSFTIILKDITNNITIVTKTQPFPLKWARWLSGAGLDAFKKDEGEENDDDDAVIDPSEWVKDWIRDGLDVSLGVVAQEYVIKRMGI